MSEEKNGKLIEQVSLVTANGITLISLVITIIILIILAGVVINLSLGENGIFNYAKEAKDITNKQTATEQINLKITTAQVNKYSEEQRMPTLKELSIVLGEDKEIEYVTEKSQVASTKYEVGENPTSIYTKLNEYPYEFEINGQLQLASINGVKIAKDNTIESMYPDYGKRKQITFTNKSYEVEQDGYVQVYFHYTASLTNTSCHDELKINGALVIQNALDARWANLFTPLFLVKKGDVVEYTNTAQNVYGYVYPFR